MNSYPNRHTNRKPEKGDITGKLILEVNSDKLACRVCEFVEEVAHWGGRERKQDIQIDFVIPKYTIGLEGEDEPASCIIAVCLCAVPSLSAHMALRDGRRDETGQTGRKHRVRLFMMQTNNLVFCCDDSWWSVQKQCKSNCLISYREIFSQICFSSQCSRAASRNWSSKKVLPSVWQFKNVLP